MLNSLFDLHKLRKSNDEIWLNFFSACEKIDLAVYARLDPHQSTDIYSFPRRKAFLKLIFFHDTLKTVTHELSEDLVLFLSSLDNNYLKKALRT